MTFDEQVKKAYSAALSALSRSDRSEAQLRELLAKKGFESEPVEVAIEKLRAYSYVDDLRYAQNIARSAQVSGLGKYRTAQKLVQKGIAKEYASQVLGELDDEREYNNALALAIKLSPKIAVKDKRSSLYRRLISKGYSSDVATRAIRQALDFEDEEVEY